MRGFLSILVGLVAAGRVTALVEPFETLDRWVVSQAKKVSQTGDDDLLTYKGVWSLEPALEHSLDGDFGLVAKTPAAHHAISLQLTDPFEPAGAPLVLQYEVKLQKGLECGGAYMKLLSHDPAFNPILFDNKSPFTIMFGPDRCGDLNRIHFIFRHKNQKSGEYEEKHLVKAPEARLDNGTNLYTLIVRPDNTFEIRVNEEVVKKGNLLEDFEPPVNPPKEIDDPSAKEPADWVREAFIPDPAAKKPVDWNDDAPATIPDMDAKKPADWIDNEPLYIQDPSVSKPADWDDEEDGEFAAPKIPNPKCTTVSGCGEWVRPTKANPEYKGIWSPPMIANPEYKGVWTPPKIPNPNYFEDLHPANFNKIGALGFEIWTMQGDILFDNIYFGSSVEEAEKFATDTFSKKKKAEPEVKKEIPTGPETTFTAKAKVAIDTFMADAPLFLAAVSQNPLEAIKMYPIVFTVGISPILLIILLIVFLRSSPNVNDESLKSKSPKKVSKKEAEEAEEEIKATAEAEDVDGDENEE